MGETDFEIFLPDADATTALGQILAPMLSAGDCVLLSGEIGAGKSHFARAIIQARLAAVGKYEDVPSPTFTIVQCYDDGRAEIWHADLYRLSDTSEVVELGLEDAFSTAISLVEWPDRLGDTRPDDALSVTFETLPEHDGRLVRFNAQSLKWQNRLHALAKANQ